MRHMFTETYKYNNPDSPLVTAAGKLQKEFEIRFVNLHGERVVVKTIVTVTLGLLSFAP